MAVVNVKFVNTDLAVTLSADYGVKLIDFSP